MPVRKKKKPRDFRQNAQRISFMRRHRTAFRRASFATAAFMVIALIMGSYLLWKNNYIQEAYLLLQKKIEKAESEAATLLGLNLKNVYLKGEKYSTLAEIMQAADLKKNQPIFLINIRGVKSRIEELDWVASADIERQIPNSLHINITEKKPIAVWQNKGELALIDEKGDLISREHVEEFPDLPLVVGEEANNEAKKIFSVLMEEPELARKVSSIIRISNRRWNLRLKNNVEVLLPEDSEAEASIRYLASLEKKKQILERRIKSVDLRLPDRIFIKEAGNDSPSIDSSPAPVKKNQTVNNGSVIASGRKLKG